MSSYLTFYLVPKKSKLKYDPDKNDYVKIDLMDEPLSLMYYCRSSEIYQTYYENLHPAYIDTEEKYTELTYEDAKRVVREYESEIEKIKKRLEIDYKMLKEAGITDELWDDIHSMEEYLDEKNDCLKDLKYIAELVYTVTEDISDFEKVLINID